MANRRIYLNAFAHSSCQALSKLQEESFQKVREDNFPETLPVVVYPTTCAADQNVPLKGKHTMTGWWFQPTPLKNHGVRQLGFLSQYMEK